MVRTLAPRNAKLSTTVSFQQPPAVAIWTIPKKPNENYDPMIQCLKQWYISWNKVNIKTKNSYMIGVDLIAVCNWMTNYSKNPPVRKLVDRKYPVETIRRKPKKGGKWEKNHKFLITFVKAVFTYLEIECGKCAWRVSMNRISTNRMDRIMIR